MTSSPQSNIIKEYRLKKPLTICQLALLLACSTLSIIRREKVTLTPSLETAFKLSLVLGVPLETLFDRRLSALKILSTSLTSQYAGNEYGKGEKTNQQDQALPSSQVIKTEDIS
jgi:transcriptional regulator with XRE-family HTH domain